MVRSLGQRVVWRRVRDFLARYQPTVVGVTGSNNKTLTVEAIRRALIPDRTVRASRPSSNKPLGVAAAILGTPPPASAGSWFRLLTGSLTTELSEEEPDTTVVEVGAHRPGDVDWVAQQVAFDIVVVTNVQSKNLTYFSSKAMVAHEHASLVATLGKDATAILNSDDPLVEEMRAHTPARVLTFGQSPDADVRLVRAQRVSSEDAHGLRHGFACEVTVAGRICEMHIPHLLHRHQLYALLSALAVGHVLGVNEKDAANRIQQLVPPPGVMRLLAGRRGSLLLDDSYAASAEDTMIALESLRSLPARRRVAILGDVVDLGGESFSWHKRIGKFAGEIAEVVVTVGEHVKDAGTEAVVVGADVHHFKHSEDVGKWLADYVHEGDVVLIKGSREMRMEEVTRRLLADPARDSDKLVQ